MEIKGFSDQASFPPIGMHQWHQNHREFHESERPGVVLPPSGDTIWTGIIGFVVAVFTWDDSWHDQVTLCSITVRKGTGTPSMTQILRSFCYKMQLGCAVSCNSNKTIDDSCDYDTLECSFIFFVCWIFGRLILLSLDDIASYFDGSFVKHSFLLSTSKIRLRIFRSSLMFST